MHLAHWSVPRPWAVLAALVLVADAACRQAAPPSGPRLPPPDAEFILAAGDSAFWVNSAAGTVHVRGAPLELARVAGRLYELYVADDDRSFEDATFVGQRVFRRDLVTGDSALVYQDTLVPHLAREYARRHPDDSPLSRGDDPSDDPRWSAVATIDLTDVHGRFVSFISHTDVERDDAAPWHTTRRGVIDLQRGAAATLAALVGTPARVAEVERARDARVRALLDSVHGDRGEQGARAAAILPFYTLDPGSYAITTVDGAPAVAFALAGRGDGDAGHLVPLAPIPIGEPAWWPEVAATLPVGSVTGTRDTWRHRGYEVVVRYDSLAGASRLALRDSSSREWTIARVPVPVTRILWLDASPLDSASRRGLERAFDESTLYDEAVRTASLRSRRSPRPARDPRVLPAARHDQLPAEPPQRHAGARR